MRFFYSDSLSTGSNETAVTFCAVPVPLLKLQQIASGNVVRIVRNIEILIAVFHIFCAVVSSDDYLRIFFKVTDVVFFRFFLQITDVYAVFLYLNFFIELISATV